MLYKEIVDFRDPDETTRFKRKYSDLESIANRNYSRNMLYNTETLKYI